MNNSSTTSLPSNVSKDLTLVGEWGLEVTRGEVKHFRVVAALSQNIKVVNAFGIYNLEDSGYIQLNDRGIEIIRGTVDLVSAGLINETIRKIEANIAITDFTQLKITLDNNISGKYFNGPILGTVKGLADGNGDILIGPTPSPPSPSSPPPSQKKSFYNFM